MKTLFILILITLVTISFTSMAPAQAPSPKSPSGFLYNISPLTVDEKTGETDYAFTTLVVAYDILQYMDLIFTYRAFANPTKGMITKDINPLVRLIPIVRYLPVHIAIKTGIVLLENYLFKEIYKVSPLTAYFIAGGITLSYTLIVLRHYRLSVTMGF